MLGCCIIMLMLGASIFGTILISADANTYDVTKYRFETEVTGLFPVDNTPEFMDYDLSRNYTGYYTIDSVINGVKYWGGATFTQTNVNNYPVKYMPLNQPVTGTYNLNNYTLTKTSPPTPDRDYVEVVFTGDGTFSEAHGQSVTVSSIISALGLNGYDIIEITPVSSNKADNIYFTTTDRYKDQGAGRWFIAYTVNPDATNLGPDTSGKGSVPWFSCKVDNITSQTSVYSSKTISQNAFKGSFDNNDLALNYVADGDSPGSAEAILGNSIKITAYMTGNIQYMDISQGVTITGR